MKNIPRPYCLRSPYFALAVLGALLFCPTVPASPGPDDKPDARTANGVHPRSTSAGQPSAMIAKTTAPTAARAINLPLFFEANQGQSDARVKFMARSRGYTLLLTPTETVLAESNTQVSARSKAFAPFEKRLITTKTSRGSVVRMQLVGANSVPLMTGLEELPGKVNYLIGNDSAAWHTNIPLYSQVRTNEVYPGVDLLFHGDQRQLEYDFVVASGADASKIAFRIRGAARMEINEDGDLVLHTAGSDFLMRKPIIYQTIGLERRAVEGGFVRKGKYEVTFRIGTYDHSRPLVIDPALGFASFLGGDSLDEIGGLAVDSSDPTSAYVTGLTESTLGSFTEPNTIVGHAGAMSYGFVAKVDPNASLGASLIYLTFVGGQMSFTASSVPCTSALAYVALDKTRGPGNVEPVMGGFTTCSDYPGTTLHSVSSGNSGPASVVTRLNTTGGGPDASVIVGGNGTNTGAYISLDSAGDVEMTTLVSSTDMPVTPGAYVTQLNNGDTTTGTDDCYTAKLRESDLSILYASYLNIGRNSATSNNGPGCGALIDTTGQFIIAGGSTLDPKAFSGTAGQPNGFQTTFNGMVDSFVMRLDISKTGSAQLTFSTFIGGGGVSVAQTGAQDLSSGVVALGGYTTSNSTTNAPDFPLFAAVTGQTTNLAAGCPQGTSCQVGYLTVLDTTKAGTASLLCSTYLGGSSGSDDVHAVALDPKDPFDYRLLVGGKTRSSTDFPLLNQFQSFQGTQDGYVAALSVPNAIGKPNATIAFSSFIGGGVAGVSGEGESIDALGVDANDQIYAAGRTLSPDFFGHTTPPTTVNGFQKTCNSCNSTGPLGPQDDSVIFVLKTAPTATLTELDIAPTAASVAVGSMVQLAAITFWSDGTIQDVTDSVVWATSPSGIVSVNGSGIATGLSAGTTTVSATFQGTQSSLNSTLTVVGGTTATHFSVTGPATATAGTTFNITVTALDASNATATGYAGTVHFTSSDGKAVLPSNSALSNGVMTFPAVLNTAGAQTITATDTVTATITGTSGTITVGGGMQVSLHVAVAGTALGTVTDNLGQINCEQISSGQGTGGCTALYTTGTQVTLTATTPGAFGGFVGSPTACTGTGTTCQFTITAAETVTATFNPGTGTFPLTVQAGATHTGGGTVTSSPTGINCILAGTVTSGTCTTNFGAGTLVTLMVTAGGGSTFFGWTGTTPNCLSSSAVSCVVGMSAATTAEVGFTSGGGTVNVTVAGPGNVKDTANANTINCTNTTGGTQTGTCTSGYALGTMVTLTETPTGTATFSGWTGSVCANPTAATCSFTVTAAAPPIAVTATFGPVATATHFSVTAPATATGGTAFNVTVTALTASNTTATGYTGTVHFTSSDAAAVLPANSMLTNGVGTFSATLITAGAQTIAATDTVTASITGTSGTITVASVGPSPTLSISKTHVGNFTQGQHSAQYTVSVSNAQNAAATSGTVTVTDASLTAFAQDFAASFSGTSNPNGVWSYGQFVESTSTFTLLPGQNAAFPTCGLPYWSGTGYPAVIANNSGSTVSCGTVTIPNDTLWTHPTNTAGTDSDVRFTAPAAGTYEVTGSFSALDSTSTLDSILVDGTPVFSTFICNPGNGNTCDTTNTQAPFSVVKTLNAGSTVDFIVNCCSGADQTFLFDSTGLSGAIDSNLSGLSLVSMFGTGWTCGAPNPANTCTRSDALAPGASYPPITVLVNVGVNASSPQVNMVSVSGGGSATANASDSTVITPTPSAQLTITKTHTGNFTQGQQNAQYSLTVANSPGAGPTGGTLTQAATVQSTGSIYDTGDGSTPPTMITLPSGATSVVFSSVTGSITTGCASTEGCIILNHGTGDNPNDPDGVGAVPATSSNTGTSSISGMTAPGAGYLVGAFVPAGGPTGTAPAALNFTSSGLSTAFTSLSPLLDQVFFIGDGLTGNGTGTQQTFNIPTGAGQLWLGISDAPGYNGAPGAYGDNLGFYTVNFSVNAPGSSAVTVTETAPSGLSLVSMAGTGWKCGNPNAANVCTRSDTLNGGAAYPNITVTVNVAANATSPQVNTAAVTGGGSAPANASDSTVIVSSSAPATHLSVTAPATATTGTAFNVTVAALTASNTTAAGYTGTVQFTSTDGNAMLPANSTLTNGVGTFSATLNTAGNQTVTATDTVTNTITGTSGTINVSAVVTSLLTVQTAGTGSGTVTGNGITCTSGSNNGCTTNVSAGTQVTLTAGPANGSTFTSWSAICESSSTTCGFTMPSTATMVTATFTATGPTLKSIAVTPANPTQPINSSLQFTATGTFSDNSTKDITTSVTWASSNQEAATITTGGLATTSATAGLTTTISATLNEVMGSTTLTTSNSPITITVTPPVGGSFPPVPPGGKLAIGIVLNSTPGFSGTVAFGCATSSPTITCAPDPASVTLTRNGPTNVAIVLNTFCKGTTTGNGSVPSPGGFAGGTWLLLLGLSLGGFGWTYRRRPRWALSFGVIALMGIGAAGCANIPRGPNGATPPGNYSVTFSATVNGVTTTTAPIQFTVQ